MLKVCSSMTKKAAKNATKNADRHKLLKSMELWRGKSVSTSFVTRVFPLANGRGGKALGKRLCLSRVILRFFLLQSVFKTPIMHLAFPPNLHKHCLQSCSRDNCNPGEVESKVMPNLGAHKVYYGRCKNDKSNRSAHWSTYCNIHKDRHKRNQQTMLRRIARKDELNSMRRCEWAGTDERSLVSFATPCKT